MARHSVGTTHALLAASCVLSIASVLACPRAAHAEEPRAPREPRIMRETGEITTVIDAFDDDDPFDANLMLGIVQRWHSAKIRRETSLNQPGLSTGGFVAATENVASYSESESVLNMGAQIGLYKDFAFTLRLPLILSMTRELTDLDGSSQNPQRLADPSGGQLFSVPHTSPSRSGIDYLALGLDYAVLNQARDTTKPTWVVGVEGRFGIGTPLHACNDAPATGAVKCPDPVSPGIDRDPGMSRATNAIFAHSTFSRRFGQVEPYTGLSFLAEFAQHRSELGGNTPKGALVNNPPLVGSILAGIEYIPYEKKESFQRIVLDGRLAGSYYSVGREYTPIFDALGTSNAKSLRQPHASTYHRSDDPAVCGAGNVPCSAQDPASEQIWFNGVTEQQAHGRITLGGNVTYQAGEYIKFNAGGSYTWVQSYLLTGADACNPVTKSDPAVAGPCHSSGAGAQQISGLPNPYHRPIIDLPGHRFSADDGGIVQIFLNGIVMF